MQAIVKIGSSQYLVSPGQELLVNLLNFKDKTGSLDQVMLVQNDQDLILGKPYIPNCYINIEILDQVKGDKVRVSKYKAKSRYRRTIGFRSKLNKVLIKDIVLK